MNKKLKRISVAVLALVMLVGIGTYLEADATEPFRYEYILKLNNTLADGVTDGKVVLDLYVTVQDVAGNDSSMAIPGPTLDGGAFALVFPSWVESMTFTKTADIMFQQLVPSARHDLHYNNTQYTHDNYHAFGWTNTISVTGAYNPAWTWLAVEGVPYWGVKMGQYEIHLPETAPGSGTYKLPGKTDIWLLDWMKADEAVAAELGAVVGIDAPDPTDMYNMVIWNDATNLYQGYYVVDDPSTTVDATEKQVDIGFKFNAPRIWTRNLTVYSYDPKKPIDVAVYSSDGSMQLATSKLAPVVWNTTDKDTDSIVADTSWNINTGNGSYATPVALGVTSELNILSKLEVGQTYVLKVSKPGHLTAKIPVTIKTENSLADAVLPDEVAANGLRLLVGDINPWEDNPDGNGVVQHYGDGRIDMQDRSAMLSVMGQPAEANYLAYHADLDGDGRVTMKDLSILMSPENYAHSAD